MFKFSIPDSKTSSMLMQSVSYNIYYNLTECGFRESLLLLLLMVLLLKSRQISIQNETVTTIEVIIERGKKAHRCSFISGAYFTHLIITGEKKEMMILNTNIKLDKTRHINSIFI